MINTVIFDMDGVIIDSEPIHLRMEAELFEKLGLKVSLEEHYSYVGGSARNMWELLARKNNLDLDVHKIVKQKNELLLDFLKKSYNLRPIEGVKELLSELSVNAFKLVLASSSNMQVIKLILKQLRLIDFFPIIVSGDELEFSKPHPQIFKRAAKLINSRPQECVVIEDSTNGVLAAKKAQMKCIGFKNPNSGYQSLDAADYVIDTFDTINVKFIREI